MSFWKNLFAKEDGHSRPDAKKMLELFATTPMNERMVDMGRASLPLIGGIREIGGLLDRASDADTSKVSHARVEVEEFILLPLGLEAGRANNALKILDKALRQTEYWQALKKGKMLVHDLEDPINPQRSVAFHPWEKIFGFNRADNGEITHRLPATMQAMTIPPREEIFNQITEAFHASPSHSR